MEKPITDAIDNLEASIDEGGNWKTSERALELVCSQRVQNLETETSKNSTTKRKRRDLPSASAWLWIAPDPVNQQQTEQALSFLRLLSSRALRQGKLSVTATPSKNSRPTSYRPK